MNVIISMQPTFIDSARINSINGGLCVYYSDNSAAYMDFTDFISSSSET